MTLLILAFVAGVLTVAAPCILPLLPVVVGGTLTDGTHRDWRRPAALVASLAGSVVVFTLLLKATTALLDVPQMVWQVVSGVIVVLFGVVLLWPRLWELVSERAGLYAGAQRLLNQAGQHQGYWREVLLGASLGPIFNSCSPTYALIVAAVLPASFGLGLAYLSAYALGLAAALLAVALFGRAVTVRMGWYANPNGALKKIVGAAFVVVGLTVIFGLDKSFQTFVLDQGWYAPVGQLEEQLRR